MHIKYAILWATLALAGTAHAAPTGLESRAPSCAPTTCSWTGHCYNDVCSSADDCDGDMFCQKGRCGTSDCPPTGGPVTRPPPTKPVPGLGGRKPVRGISAVTKCKIPGTAAWTFDDGPHIYTGQILDALKAAGMKATFFLTGNNYGCIYDPENIANVKRMVAEGHQVAAHTWSHPNIAMLSVGQFNYQMRKLEDAFMKILGMTPKYFRQPFGFIQPVNFGVLSTLGYKIVWMDVDSEDANGVTVERSQELLTEGLSTGDMHIVLDHEPIQTTAEQLVPWFIENFKDKYKWVTVAECLGETESPYMVVKKLDETTNTCSDKDVKGYLPMGR